MKVPMKSQSYRLGLASLLALLTVGLMMLRTGAAESSDLDDYAPRTAHSAGEPDTTPRPIADLDGGVMLDSCGEPILVSEAEILEAMPDADTPPKATPESAQYDQAMREVSEEFSSYWGRRLRGSEPSAADSAEMEADLYRRMDEAGLLIESEQDKSSGTVVLPEEQTIQEGRQLLEDIAASRSQRARC